MNFYASELTCGNAHLCAYLSEKSTYIIKTKRRIHSHFSLTESIPALSLDTTVHGDSVADGPRSTPLCVFCQNKGKKLFPSQSFHSPAIICSKGRSLLLERMLNTSWKKKKTLFTKIGQLIHLKKYSL